MIFICLISYSHSSKVAHTVDKGLYAVVDLSA